MLNKKRKSAKVIDPKNPDDRDFRISASAGKGKDDQAVNNNDDQGENKGKGLKPCS